MSQLHLNQLSVHPSQLSAASSELMQPQPQAQLMKPSKLRRSRQPRNPQLSVARRNERERNRVKMVNNGFALLRNHLPVADLAACETGTTAGSGSESPDAGARAAGSKARKFSKVETLRAAIKRIRWLEELIRSTEEQCCSSRADETSAQAHLYLEQQQQQQQQHQAPHQFVRLSAGSAAQQQQPQPAAATATCSRLSSPPSYLSHGHSHSHNHITGSQQLSEAPSHTHLWIQQHQSSFMEQQWYHASQQQQPVTEQPAPEAMAASPWSCYNTPTLEASPTASGAGSGSELAGAPHSPLLWPANGSPQHQHQHQPSAFQQQQISLYSQ